MIYSIDEIVSAAVERRASDIHIGCDCPVKFRIDGSLTDFDDHVLTNEDCLAYARTLSRDYDAVVEEIGEKDMSLSVRGGVRCRINVYRERGSVAIAIRILNNRIRTYEELGLPSVVPGLATLEKGLVLVTGPAGSGKSTTLAYLVNEVNKNLTKHVVTFEDPIEYIHFPIKSIVSQREVGTDTRSLKEGLRAVLREDPDVIMIGELRTLDEIELALTIAETGHLVFASLHTNSAAETVDRIVDVYPAAQQSQVRMQLSMTLNTVISQQLIPRRFGGGRVLATEVMVCNSAVANLIREGKTPQIDNVITTTADNGSHLMDTSLVNLYKQRLITKDEALRRARNLEFVSRILK